MTNINSVQLVWVQNALIYQNSIWLFSYQCNCTKNPTFTMIL